MAFNINEFRSRIGKVGFFHPSHFEFIIAKEGIDFSDLRYRCKSVEHPGRDTVTGDVKYTGPVRTFAYDVIYNPLTVTIILDENLKQKELLEQWMDQILGNNRNEDSTNMFNLGYYDDYVGTGTIITYKNTGEKSSETTYVEMFPKTIGDVNMSWDNGNEIAELPVTFNYRYFKKKES